MQAASHWALPASSDCLLCLCIQETKDMLAALTVGYWIQCECAFKCVAACRLKKRLLLPAAPESAWVSIKTIVAASAMLFGVAAGIRGSASCLVYALYLFLATCFLSLSPSLFPTPTCTVTHSLTLSLQHTQQWHIKGPTREKRSQPLHNCYTAWHTKTEGREGAREGGAHRQ